MRISANFEYFFNLKFAVKELMPQVDVDNLIQRVAFEAGLELSMELPSGVHRPTIGASTQVSQGQDEPSQRLARLRQAE
ncbi:charged multivesicular body protein 1b-like [Eurosta solidaginis]|uniref:charged multivesicular body protein 1b-like n=1 Tax=Eurosta solidaginis TaxID=178769 RepID=UPI00353150FF